MLNLPMASSFAARNAVAVAGGALVLLGLLMLTLTDVPRRAVQRLSVLFRRS